MLVFMFVGSLRQRSFDLYVNCLDRPVILMFILDANNYARWLPYHIRDMKSLPASVKRMFQAVGLFHDHLSLLQWSIVATEVSRMVNEFLNFLPDFTEPDDEYQHHEETIGF